MPNQRGTISLDPAVRWPITNIDDKADWCMADCCDDSKGKGRERAHLSSTPVVLTTMAMLKKSTNS
jgi:hypothetical protein